MVEGKAQGCGFVVIRGWRCEAIFSRMGDDRERILSKDEREVGVQRLFVVYQAVSDHVSSRDNRGARKRATHATESFSGNEFSLLHFPWVCELCSIEKEQVYGKMANEPRITMICFDIGMTRSGTPYLLLIPSLWTKPN